MNQLTSPRAGQLDHLQRRIIRRVRLVADVGVPASTRAQGPLCLDFEDVQGCTLRGVRGDDIDIWVVVRVPVYQRVDVEVRVDGLAGQFTHALYELLL